MKIEPIATNHVKLVLDDGTALDVTDNNPSCLLRVAVDPRQYTEELNKNGTRLLLRVDGSNADEVVRIYLERRNRHGKVQDL